MGGNQRRSLGEVVEPPAVKVFKSTSAQHVSDESSLPGGGVRTGWPSEFPFSLTSFFSDLRSGIEGGCSVQIILSESTA